MRKISLKPYLSKGLLLLVIGIASGVPNTTFALADEYFLQNNNIFFYVPGNECDSGSSPVGKGISVSDNKDYAGNQIISDANLVTIKQFQPRYEAASKETGIPWQMFAVVHLRESVLADYNPGNGQGIYQDSVRRFNDGKDYPPGLVTEAEFIRQTVNAGKELIEKVELSGHTLDEIKKGDPAAIKDAFFYYNGAAGMYIDQAIALFGANTPGAEGSPYVMNRADLKRDPTAEPTKGNNTWGQVKVDYGGLSYPANGDHGAFVMYAALANLPSTGSSIGCVGRMFGATANGWAASAMQVYYQDEEPWASTQIGPYTIKGVGCGPTSAAMAIATLNNDTSITPQVMAQYFYDNGGLLGNGTQFLIWPKVAEKYNVKITDIGTDMSKAADAVRRGSFVIISANGCPFACAGGHILLIRGVTSSGKFLVADPWKNWGDDSDKTHNEEGYEITSAAANGINYMWEVSK